MQDDLPRPVFVGRDRQLAALAGDGRRVLAEGARAVLVCGDAGMGKTRLIDEYRARTPLARTAVGGCLELGGDGIPFAPFTALLRDLSREGAAGPVPGTGRTPGGDDTGRARLFESVLTLLEERAGRGGLLAVVEDLHWADASTRDLLVFLLRNLGEAPVHLVVSVRTDDLHRTHPLRRLLPGIERLPRVSRLDLEPFSRDEVAAQAAALRDGPCVDIDLLHERSGGNPLFVEALLDRPSGPLPEGSRELLSAAVDRLPEDARRVVGLIAAAGDRIGHTLLAAVARRAGISEEALDTALRPAVDVRVLRATADGYVFRHALLAEAVYTDLLPGERIRAHRRYAEALGRGVPGLTGAETALQLAHHAYAAGDQPLALSTAWEAARHAADTAAHPERLALLERVLELWDPVPDAAARVGEPRAEVLRRAASVCLLAGSLRRAVDYATEGLEELGVTGYHRPGAQAPPDGALIAGLRYVRAYAYKELGRDGGLEDLADAFVVMGEGHPGAAAAGALLASTFMGRNHPSQARRSAHRALREAREAGDRDSEADVLVTLGSLTAAQDPDEALRLLGRGVALARATGNVQGELRGWVNLAGTLAETGRVEEAYDTARRGLARTEEMGLARTQGPSFRLSMAVELFYLLRVREGERLLDPSAGDRLVRARTWTLLQQIAFLRRDTGGAATALEEFHRLLPEHSSSPSEYTPVRFTEMMLAAVEGRFDAAAEVARRFLGAGDPEDPHLDTLYMGTLSFVAEVVDLMREEPGRAEEAAGALAAELRAALDALPGEIAHPRNRQLRDQARAQVLDDAGAASRALEELLAEVVEHRFQRVYLLLAAARAAARAGRGDAAAGHLAEVEEAARESGLTLFGELADRIRGRHGLPRPRATAGEAAPAGLTRREAQVLRLVARGMTNREVGERLFISAKTVSVHVSNLMGKLGVANRNAAAVRARELGLD